MGATMTESGDASTAVHNRYRDAYTVAASIAGLGSLVKTLGIVAGVVVALLGLASAGSFGAGAFVVFLILAVGVGGMFFMFGVMVAAQGQVLLAVLDTAVNTSPLLSVEQKGEVIVALGGRDHHSEHEE